MQVGVNQVCVVEWSAGLQVIENSPLAPPPPAVLRLSLMRCWDFFFSGCFSFFVFVFLYRRGQREERGLVREYLIRVSLGRGNKIVGIFE